jgi:Cu(I)/Ag(I) efflux system membrane protein CusA/SilA
MFGAVERVRPKMMTVVAIMAGLLPIMWSTGTGSEVMQRIAVPMIGGMVSSTVLTLVVIPVIYSLVKGWGLPEPNRYGPDGRRSAATGIVNCETITGRCRLPAILSSFLA